MPVFTTINIFFFLIILVVKDMKKIALFSIAVLMCMIGIMVVYAKPEGSETLYENLTTKNFLKKMKDINYQEI